MGNSTNLLRCGVLLAAALPAGAASADTPTRVELAGTDEAPALAISHPALPRPLRISIAEIYFETAAGRASLSGRPARIETPPGGLRGRWTLRDGRAVELEVLPDGKDGPHVTVALHAKPDADILKWGFSLDASPDEYFTGLLERVVDGPQHASWEAGITEALNLRGQIVNMAIEPTVSLYAPFYLSSRGYGLFVEGTWPGRFDLGKEDAGLVRVAFEGPSLRFHVYVGSPAEVVQAHALAAGPPLAPPRWAYTAWRWRDEHRHRPAYYDRTPVRAPYNSQVVEDILMMEAFDIPCGVYWVDRPWAPGPEGYDDFEWDPKRFPNAGRMIRWLQTKKVKFVVWIAPWVMGTMAREARARGYVLPGEEKSDGPSVDFTHPEARAWWQQGVRKLLDAGVAGFKLDRGEEGLPFSRRQRVHDGRTTRETRNDYPHQYIQATHEICRKVRGEDFVLMPRAGYTGSSRYGAFWGGDIGGTEWGLRTAIIAAQRAAIMGYPIWGSDTGGYWDGLDREVAARWLAFSCFTPIFEVGPTLNRAFWDMPTEPRYDAELIAVWRLYAHLHTRLADYTEKHARQARETGLPVIRPLFLAFPDQKPAWEDWPTYLYGDDILVSTVWRKGTREHALYLPAGARWRDAWRPDAVLEGGQTITVEVPLERIPIFIREGAAVTLGDLPALYRASLERARRKPDLGALEKKVR